MNKKTIIYIKDNNGRLGNLLWSYASLICIGKELGYEIYNPSFFEYFKYFPQIDKINKNYNITLYNILIKLNKIKNRKIKKILYLILIHIFFLYKKLINRKKNKYLKIKQKPFIIKNNFLKNYKGYNNLYLNGRFFAPKKLLNKYHKIIINIFKPQNKTINNIEKKISNYKKKYDIIIGVHIRRGDYKKWKNGKFYITDEQAYKKLLKIKNKYRSKKILFLICSDEKINLKKYPNINIIQNNGNFIEDLYILSKTNFIIGSNSTYGRRAAYYGNIKFYLL